MSIVNGELLNGFAADCHEANKKWWCDLTKPCDNCKTRGWVHTSFGGPKCPECNGRGYAKKDRNVGELIALCHSELSEALEGHRKGLQDDKLPNRPMVEVELADLLIRVFDMAGGLRLDIGGAYVEKMAYNAQRQDHTIAGRLAEGGKKY